MTPPPSARPLLRAVALAMLTLAWPATIVGSPSGVQAVPTGAQAVTVAVDGKIWSWPLDEPHPIVRPFIAPASAYSSGHRGIDIAGTDDEVVRAPAAGIIHFSGFVVNRYVVSIDHGGGVLSSFEPVLSELVEGALVRRGERIGALQSGHCGAPCLHFGVRVDGLYVSPLNFLGDIPRSILLPTRPLP